MIRIALAGLGALALVACSTEDKGAEGACKDHPRYDKRYPEYDKDCAGGTGCTTRIPMTCGCQCYLCEGELCVAWVCDDSCPPPACPAARPAQGEACASKSFAQWKCNYPAPAPCCDAGSAVWKCVCKGTWDCVLDPPCSCDAGADARPRDAGPGEARHDARGLDGAPAN